MPPFKEGHRPEKEKKEYDPDLEFWDEELFIRELGKSNFDTIKPEILGLAKRIGPEGLPIVEEHLSSMLIKIKETLEELEAIREKEIIEEAKKGSKSKVK